MIQKINQKQKIEIFLALAVILALLLLGIVNRHNQKSEKAAVIQNSKGSFTIVTNQLEFLRKELEEEDYNQFTNKEEFIKHLKLQIPKLEIINVESQKIANNLKIITNLELSEQAIIDNINLINYDSNSIIDLINKLNEQQNLVEITKIITQKINELINTVNQTARYFAKY